MCVAGMVSPSFEPAACEDVVAAGLVRHPHDSEVVRRHADTFAFPAFH